MTTPHEVALLRLAAQRIAGPGLPTAAEAVRWMTGVQAQDWSGALASVALRTASRSRVDVEDALESGAVVRSWPMRGTLHLVPAEDLAWMLQLAAPRMLAGAAARRAELGLDPGTLERAREVAVTALTGGQRRSREELSAAWDEAGLGETPQRRSHLLSYVAQTGTVCLGPLRGRHQLVVLAEEWVPHLRRLERDEALGEWAERYFRAHGPATVRDFARWTGLPAADVRAGLALARPRLASLDVDGVEHLMDPGTPGMLAVCRDEARGTFLLPGFDEFMLGYADRSAALPPEFADRIVPGGNGVFRPTVVSDGRVVGTWRHARRGAKRTVAATPFSSFPDEVAEEISRAYAALP